MGKKRFRQQFRSTTEIFSDRDAFSRLFFRGTAFSKKGDIVSMNNKESSSEYYD